MGTDQWLHLLTWALGFIIIGVASYITYTVMYAFKNEKRHADMELKFSQAAEKIQSQEVLIGHLVKAGENIKEQLNIQQISVASIQKDISSIDTALKSIIQKLDNQDRNILAFYRDLDIRKKGEHE